MHVLRAGALVLQEGLLAVKHYQYNHIFFRRDSKILIDKVNGTCSTPWCIKMLVQDIKTLVSSFEVIYFRHVLIEVNFVANVYC